VGSLKIKGKKAVDMFSQTDSLQDINAIISSYFETVTLLTKAEK
jgi:hypothetical protein